MKTINEIQDDELVFDERNDSHFKKKRALFSIKEVLGLSVDKEDFDVNSLF